jgi:quercetin dioxygenase-like cupin family protein
MEMAPGITRELFAAIPPARAEGHTLYQARFTFNPGAEIMPHGHPGSVLLCVSSGTFGWTLVEGVAHVVRGAASGEAVPTEDVSASGTDIILEPGDAIYYEDDVVHTARGAGDEPAIVLGSLLLTTGEPFMIPAEM